MADFNLTATSRRKETKIANFHFKGSAQFDRGVSPGSGSNIEAGLVCFDTVLFNEASLSAAGVYTGSVTIPAGSILLDVIITAIALWDAGTAAALIVGDGDDPNGFFDAVSLKATDLLAGESINFVAHGGKPGAYIVGTLPTGHWEARYDADERTITGEVTTTGTFNSGTGRTRMTVVYCTPPATTGESTATAVAT